MEKKCLNCKFYRLDDLFSGRCRVDKSIDREKLPIMKHDDICDSWKDAGQQYYIRLGWIKSMEKKEKEIGKIQ